MRLTSQILEVRLLLCPFIFLVWGSWLYFKGSTLFNSWSISSKYLQKYIHKQQKKKIFCVEIIITLTINNTIRNCNIEIFRFIVSFFRTRVGFLIARSTCPCLKSWKMIIKKGHIVVKEASNSYYLALEPLRPWLVNQAVTKLRVII